MPEKRTTIWMLLLLALNLGAISCQKLETAAPPPNITAAKSLEPIPLDYGELVAVTPYPEDPHWVALWFQKPDKSIAVVAVNVTQGKILARAVIPRR